MSEDVIAWTEKVCKAMNKLTLEARIMDSNIPKSEAEWWAQKEIADLRARCEKAERDAERLDWLEAQHTLHGAVEFLYVVIGYEAQLTYDGNPRGPKFQADTLREVIDAAMAYPI